MTAPEQSVSLRQPLKCYLPFTTTTFSSGGAFFPCLCGYWLRDCFGYGNARQKSLDELWNSERMQAMRAAFYAGRYTDFCLEGVCGVLRDPAPPIAEDPHLTPETIALMNAGATVLPLTTVTQLSHNVDRGCNLSCPMCRGDHIPADRSNIGISVAEIRSIVESGTVRTLRMSGEGEIFIMKEVVELLASDFLSGRGIALQVVTNCTAFTPRLWEKIGHNIFAEMVISADGCSAATYEQVRLGAQWENTLRNMEFAAQLHREGKIGALGWHWVVMPINIADMGDGVLLARRLGFDWLNFLQQAGQGEGAFHNLFDNNDIDQLDRIHDILVAVDAVRSFPPVIGRRYRNLDQRGQTLARTIGQSWNYLTTRAVCERLERDCLDGGLIVDETLSDDAVTGFATGHLLGVLDFADLAGRAPTAEMTDFLRRTLQRMEPARQSLLDEWGQDFWSKAAADFAVDIEAMEHRLASADTLLVWGAGNTGAKVAKRIKAATGRIPDMFIDIAKTGTFQGVPVGHPDEIPKTLRQNAIVVIGSQFGFALYGNARKLGFEHILNGTALLGL